jgi:ADP-ribose pyrophosphatase YjhB (NUDIX family)
MTQQYRNPKPTVDIIIQLHGDAVVLVRRRNPPPGWAIPGGFVDEGESLETAARREALEETSLEVELLYQLHTYSDPGRDPRFHTISTVFVAKHVGGILCPKDDATEAGIYTRQNLPPDMAFDHRAILEDYWSRRWFEYCPNCQEPA